MKHKFNSVKVNGSPLACFIGLSAALFMLWILFSGIIEAKFMVLGVVFSVFTAYICFPCLFLTNNVTGRQYFMLKLNYFKFVLYFLWLLWKILFAGLIVTKGIFYKESLQPRVEYFRIKYQNPAATALLAISITLLPGIITLDLEESGVVEVHVLNDELEDFIHSGIIQQKVADVFGEEVDFEAMPQHKQRDIPRELD